MEKEFVPYELALRLKALGFNKPCFGFWKSNIKYQRFISDYGCNSDLGVMFGKEAKLIPTAPTFSQAFLFVMQFPQIKKYRYNIALYSDGTYSIKDGKDSIYEYLSAEACLDKLLEIVESKK